MAQFRPSAYINVRNFQHENFEYPTYKALLKDMNNLFSKSYDGVVRVYRSRRGQWGEWFEVWQDGKIEREGWM